MNLDLQNKVILLTGATGGIGKQVVLDFLQEDSIVICLIRNQKKMDEMRGWLKEHETSDLNVHSYVCDLMNFENVNETVKLIINDFNRIDVLVNCAGFAHEYPFALLNESQIDEMIDLNFKSPLYLIHAVLRPMFKQKEGCIINISSVSAVKKGRGIATYASSKAALETFTRALSQEVGRKNIRVNCIRPGVINTSMSEGLIDRSEDVIQKSTALARHGFPNEISKAILFVASNKTASYMTGESFSIDGGMY